MSQEEREEWFNWYVHQVGKEKKWAKYRERFLCPCCFMPTLDERRSYDICSICEWEDDGQDTDDAEVVRGGPNGDYSLKEARDNFEKYHTMYHPSDNAFYFGRENLPVRKKIYQAFSQAMQSGSEKDWEVALETFSKYEKYSYSNLKEVDPNEQLKILKEEGVETWNKWREDNPEVKIDLGIDFSGVDLRGSNLSCADLSVVKNLKGADLSNTNLSYAKLNGADLKGANFNGANLSYADLRFTHLNNANLKDSDLQGAFLEGADLQGAHLNNADLRGADLEGAHHWQEAIYKEDEKENQKFIEKLKKNIS